MLTRPSHIVTVLAFIFVPISLASSIFGMNVQQINDSGHSIFSFVYTSIVLLTVSALGFFFRHAMKRIWLVART
jgi:Mg2+ and Co2+ transporter CorA